MRADPQGDLRMTDSNTEAAPSSNAAAAGWDAASAASAHRTLAGERYDPEVAQAVAGARYDPDPEVAQAVARVAAAPPGPCPFDYTEDVGGAGPRLTPTPGAGKGETAALTAQAELVTHSGAGCPSERRETRYRPPRPAPAARSNAGADAWPWQYEDGGGISF
jgi:hypothetical protein